MCRGVAARGRSLKALQANRFQIGGHTGIEPTRWHDLPALHLRQHRGQGLALEGRPSRDCMVEHAAESIDIAPLRGLPEIQLLWGNESRRAHRRSGQRECVVGIDQLRQAEVRQARTPAVLVRFDEDVRWLDVAVQHALGMRVRNRERCVTHPTRCQFHRHLTFCDDGTEPASLHELHHQIRHAIVFADLVN